MPCTLPGLEAVRRFKVEMFKMISSDKETQEVWEHIFGSAKNRILYGYPKSSNPVHGDTEEEHTIMKHLTKFMRKWKNPNYKMSTYEKQCLTNGTTPEPSNFIPPPENEEIPGLNGGTPAPKAAEGAKLNGELRSIAQGDPPKPETLSTTA